MQNSPAPSDQEIPVGLVGYGLAGQYFHAPVIAGVPGLRLAAVASRQADKVHADWPQAAVHPDLDTLLSAHPEVALVVIAAPNAEHHPLARAALQAGRHVVVDKPFTLDAAQARDLAALARHHDRLLSVYQNRRFDADFLSLQAVLASGELGRPVALESRIDRFRPEVKVRWRDQPGPGAGLWPDLGAHLVDQALQLFGPPDSLSLDLAGLRDGAQVEDHFHAVLRYEAGRSAPLRVVLHAATLAAHPLPRFVLHGTRGSYVKQGVDPQEDALRAGQRPQGDGWGADADAGVLTVADAQGALHARAWPTLNGDYRRYYAAVRDALRGAGPNPVPPEQAVQLMQWLDLGRRSAQEGRGAVALTK